MTVTCLCVFVSRRAEEQRENGRNYINYIYRVKQICHCKKTDSFFFFFFKSYVSESIMKYLFWDCFILTDQPILTPLKTQSFAQTTPNPPLKISDDTIFPIGWFTRCIIGLFSSCLEREKRSRFVVEWLLRKDLLFAVLHGRVSPGPRPKPAFTPSLKSPLSTYRVGDIHGQDSSYNQRAVLGIGPVF